MYHPVPCEIHYDDGSTEHGMIFGLAGSEDVLTDQANSNRYKTHPDLTMAEKFRISNAKMLAGILPKNEPVVDRYPQNFFFYGSLNNPSRLATILGLDTEPILQPARALGFKRKYHGQISLMTKDRYGTVEGASFIVESQEQADQLFNVQSVACFAGLYQTFFDDESIAWAKAMYWDLDEDMLADEPREAGSSEANYQS